MAVDSSRMDPEDPVGVRVRSRNPSSVSLLSGLINAPVSKSALFLHQVKTPAGVSDHMKLVNS